MEIEDRIEILRTAGPFGLLDESERRWLAERMTWIMGGMMTGTHGGMGWGMMGNGWRSAGGSEGMVFSFTTA